MGRKDSGQPSGVRGPGGPPGARGPRQPRQTDTNPTASRARLRFEQASYPGLRALHGAPRWLMVVLPAAVLFGGLVTTGPWRWLGAALLLVVAAFLCWLLALSWPVLSTGSRLTRLLTVVAVAGLAVLKALGRF